MRFGLKFFPIISALILWLAFASPCGLLAAEVKPVAPATPVPSLQQTGNAYRHVVKPGESLGTILREYISHTSYMTGAELEAALRQANNKPTGNNLKPGQEIIIPGYESAAIVEHSVPVSKDFQVKAIYLTGIMAGSDRGIRLVREWQSVGGNAVVFDIKDSDGALSIAFDHRLAPHRHPYIANLPKFVRFLHSQHMHAIARIALFRDELMVKNHPELAVQSRRALQAAADKSLPQPWRENGKLVWTDCSRREVQDYNLALAQAAIAGGADEVQFDYVRFPAEGDQADAQFAFMSEHPAWKRADVIADFLSRAYSQIHARGVLLSLDVFGVMAWQRPVDLNHTGQDIVRMAKFCDVLSPMIYPSHFFGMDGYALPGDAPEHFINESMERFRAITQGSGVVLRPWLQAFAWRTKTYSPQYIETQVRSAQNQAGIGYLFWNARNDYGRPFTAMAEMREHPIPVQVAPLEAALTGHAKANAELAKTVTPRRLRVDAAIHSELAAAQAGAPIAVAKAAMESAENVDELQFAPAPQPALDLDLDPCRENCAAPDQSPVSLSPQPRPSYSLPAGPPV